MNNVFHFWETCWIQKKDTAMGTPLAVLHKSIVMGYHKKQALIPKQPPLSLPPPPPGWRPIWNLHPNKRQWKHSNTIWELLLWPKLGQLTHMGMLSTKKNIRLPWPHRNHRPWWKPQLPNLSEALEPLPLSTSPLRPTTQYTVRTNIWHPTPLLGTWHKYVRLWENNRRNFPPPHSKRIHNKNVTPNLQIRR